MNKTRLRIHTWPEKILKVKCKRVDKVDDGIRDLLSEMTSLMRAHDGVGLAANQAGLNLSLVVVELENKLFKLVNPLIVRKEGKMVFREGCLSFPGLEIDIKRSSKAWIKARDEEGKEIEIEVQGILAVIFQHEIDHIEGIPFIDRAHFWQRFKTRKQLNKIIRRTRDGLRK